MTTGRIDGAMRVAALCALALAGGCKSSDAPKKSTAFASAPDPKAERPTDMPAEAPKPWTERFLEVGVLVADEIRIEGPKPLLDHVVTRPETGVHDVQVKTIPAGFEQTISVRAPGAEIRGQIDQLALSAMRRIVILERPGEVDVLVIAAGDVFWKDGPKKEPARSQSLRIEGPIRR